MEKLTPEETRWLVVGICILKVLTPAIRSVIGKEIRQLYQKMVLEPTKIHLQTSSSYHERFPPSTVDLEYKNINNNAKHPSDCNYDRRVKDELSLAKLFVTPSSSGFTGFDETMDSSAALSILCAAPNYVCNGTSVIARDVRKLVRNEWGHCKIAIWTEAYYQKCFQLMKKLISKLNLPEASKKDFLKDLQEWRQKGIEMCVGQQISSEVLKLLHEEMAALWTSVDENKESWGKSHKGLRDNLSNLKGRVKELEAKHADLKRGLNFVKEDCLKLKKEGVILSQKIEWLNSREETVPPDMSASGLHWKLLVFVLLLAFVLFLYEQSFGECGMFHYWYSRAALFWKILVVILLVGVVIFLYQHFARGTTLRYWYSNCGCIPGHKLSFVYKTFDRQTPKVNGVEFDWDKLKNKLSLTFEAMDRQGMHYYLNIDRYAYGGVVHVASRWDNIPQVRGPEIFAVNSEYAQVYYHDDGKWHPYISARDIRYTTKHK